MSNTHFLSFYELRVSDFSFLWFIHIIIKYIDKVLNEKCKLKSGITITIQMYIAFSKTEEPQP